MILFGFFLSYYKYALEIATRLTWHKDLSSRNDYREALKGRGIPTVFVCSINVDAIEQNALKELSGILIAETFRSLLNANHIPESRRFGFGISGALDPMFILRHYHPKNVNDPLL